MDIPFFKLSSGSEELANVKEVLESGWVTTGKWGKKLESLFQDYCGVSHALAVNSCTAALHLAIEALGIGEGDAVIVPSLTFTASAEIIRYVGADPVFIDVDPETLLITPDLVEDAILRHPNVKAVVAVHFAGQAAELGGENGIMAVCRRYGVRVIEDAAHAFPSYDTYGPVGCFGDVCCFSFYANKTITSGEGGMLVTNNEEVAQRARLMRLHGIDRDVWGRFSESSATAWIYDVKAPGFKYNMPDLNASVGVAQFAKAWDFRSRRQEIARRYSQSLRDIAVIHVPKSRVAPESHAYHLFPMVLRPEARLTRQEFIVAMSDRGIGTSVHYRPLHRMSYYKERYGLEETDFPNTESYWRGCVSLPIYPALQDCQVDEVINAIKELVG